MSIYFKHNTVGPMAVASVVFWPYDLGLEINRQQSRVQKRFSLPVLAALPLPNRFMATSKRHDEYLKTFEPENQENFDVEDGEAVSEGEAAADARDAGGERNTGDTAAADSGVTNEGRTGPARNGRRSSTAPPGGEMSPDEGIEKEKEHVADAVGNRAREDVSRKAGKDLTEEQLEKEMMEMYKEMKECMIFHDLL